MAKLTKGERIARQRLFQHLAMAEADTPDWDRIARQVPEAWHLIAHDLDVTEPKEKVTLYLDRSTARLFRGMGKGYHARINRILSTWASMEIAGLLEFRAMFKTRMSEMVQADKAAMERGETGPGFGSGVGD